MKMAAFEGASAAIRDYSRSSIIAGGVAGL
jgi:hypothetical protein